MTGWTYRRWALMIACLTALFPLSQRHAIADAARPVPLVAQPQPAEALQSLLTLPVEAARSLHFSADGRSLYVASDASPLTRWELDTATAFPLPDEIGSPAYAVSADDSRIAFSWLSDLGGFQIYDLSTVTLTADVPCSGGASQIAFNPRDRDQLLVGVVTGYPATYLDRWEITPDLPFGRGDDAIRACRPTQRVPVNSLTPFALSPDGRLVLAGDRLFTADTLRPLATIRLDPDQREASAAFSPDGAQLALAAGQLAILFAPFDDPSTALVVRELETAALTATRVVYSPSGDRLAVSGYGSLGPDGAYRAFAALVDTTTWTVAALTALPGDAPPWPPVVAISPDGTRLAAAAHAVHVYAVGQ